MLLGGGLALTAGAYSSQGQGFLPTLKDAKIL